MNQETDKAFACSFRTQLVTDESINSDCFSFKSGFGNRFLEVILNDYLMKQIYFYTTLSITYFKNINNIS